MGLIKAFWKTLIHLGKYRWVTIEFKDGSILIGAATSDLWGSLKDSQNDL